MPLNAIAKRRAYRLSGITQKPNFCDVCAGAMPRFALMLLFVQVTIVMSTLRYLVVGCIDGASLLTIALCTLVLWMYSL